MATDYRQPPPPPPLVVVLQGRIVAVDARDGRLLWTFSCTEQVRRLLPSGDRLFVCTPDCVYCVRTDSGEQVGRVVIPMETEAGLAHDGLLILAGDRTAVCLDEGGRVLWSIRVDCPSVTQDRLVGIDGQGNKSWESPTSKGVDHRQPPGLVWGEQVAQPDLVGRQ